MFDEMVIGSTYELLANMDKIFLMVKYETIF